MKTSVKKILIVLFSFILIFNVTSKEYKAINTYQISSGKIAEYRLKNNIPVYMNLDVPNQVNAVYLIVEGGTLCLDNEYSGLETSLFEMMTYGSKKYNYDQIQLLKYQTQSSIGHYSLYSGSVLTLNCINYYLDQMLPVFLDGFLNPSFNKNEYDLMIHGIAQTLAYDSNDPESILLTQIRNQVFENSPLLTSSSVKEESFKNITIENLKKHHKKIIDASRIKIVAVGKFDEQKFLSQLDSSLGKLKRTKFIQSQQKEQVLNITDKKVVMSHKNAVGSEMAIRVFQSPSVLSDDYVAGQICSDIFSTIMFNIIREKYGACYTPGSSIESSFNPIGFDYEIKVSDIENLEKYFQECMDLMLSDKVISSVDKNQTIYESIEDCLSGYINAYITKKYISQSSSSGIASRITSSILQFGNLTTADKIPEQALKVTASDIHRVFKKYWLDGKNQWFIMIGEK